MWNYICIDINFNDISKILKKNINNKSNNIMFNTDNELNKKKSSLIHNKHNVLNSTTYNSMPYYCDDKQPQNDNYIDKLKNTSSTTIDNLNQKNIIDNDNILHLHGYDDIINKINIIFIELYQKNNLNDMLSIINDILYSFKTKIWQFNNNIINLWKKNQDFFNFKKNFEDLNKLFYLNGKISNNFDNYINNINSKNNIWINTNNINFSINHPVINNSTFNDQLPTNINDENNTCFSKNKDDKKNNKIITTKLYQVNLNNFIDKFTNLKKNNYSYSLEQNSNNLCWWCCLNIQNKIYSMPHNIIETNKKIHIYLTGIFCWLNCSLAYNLSINDFKQNERLSYFNFYVKYCINITNNENIIPSLPKELLNCFGGPLSIEEYKKNHIVINENYKKHKVYYNFSKINNIYTPNNIEENIYIENNSSSLKLKRSKPLARFNILDYLN